MAKAPHVGIDDAFEDFGFSAVSEEELKQVEQQLKEEVQQTKRKLQQKEESDKTYKAKMERMYKMIIPHEFIGKLDALFEEEQ